MSHNILVTGGAGYLGSILVPDLIQAGHKVTVLDNFMFRQTSLNHVCHYSNFSVINGDIRDESLVAKFISQADIIIPLAAYVGAPLCNRDPYGAQSVNRDAMSNMLRMASQQQWILMPTTNSAYGSGNKENHCSEDSILNPISRYAIDKVEIEKQLMDHPNAISFRLATVFGMSPRMRLDLLVNDFTYRAVNDKFVVLFESHFKRNYIHVRDVSRVFQHGMNQFEGMRGKVFNVGLSNANVSKLELCETIRKVVPDFVFLDAPVGKDPDQRNYIVSNQRIEATGFEPKTTLTDGIFELVKGFKMIRNNRFGNV